MPRVSSENREYVPIAFLSHNIIAHEKLLIIPGASKFLFGILTSKMHMVWAKLISGRLESRISYSPAVYNNYPFPENTNINQIDTVTKYAQAILDVRSQFDKSSLANLYDPTTMPPTLVKAHQSLDKAVDLCYRSQPFTNETKRIEFLFDLYDKYTSGLFAKGKTSKIKKEQ